MKFVEARWHGQGGNDHPTRIVIHDAEFPEKVTGAEDVAAYFQHVERKASAHYVCDNDSTVQCVKAGDVAYHAPPNARSIGIELCGYAKQTTADWLDAYGVAMLRDQAAPLVRDIAANNGIPLVWLSVDDLLAGKHGVTSHNNVSLAWHQSTHTDPGGNFPIDQFMAWVTQGDDDMYTDVDRARDDATRTGVAQLVNADGRLVDLLNAIKADVEDADSHGGPGQITPAAIDAIAKAVQDEAADRLKA